MPLSYVSGNRFVAAASIIVQKIFVGLIESGFELTV